MLHPFNLCALKQLLLAVLFSNLLQAQVLPHFAYTEDDGLPSSIVYQCIQDRQGFLWLATEFGLSRFDGHNFKNYTVKDGLYVNDVWGLFEDSKERLWIRSFSPNLSYIRKGEIHHIPIPDSLDVPWVHDIKESKDGVLWFSTANGIISLDKSSQLHFIKDNYSPNKLRAQLLLEDDRGKWFINSNQLILQKEGELSKWQLPVSEGEEVVYVWKKSKDGWLIFLEDKLVEWSFKTGLKKEYSWSSILPYDKEYRLNRIVGSYKNSQRHWLLTDHGLFALFDDLSLDSTFLFLHDKTFEHVYKDKEDNLWMCGRGKGLCFFPARSLQMDMISYQIDTDYSPFKVLSFAEDKSNNLWVGSSSGVLKRLKNGSFRKVTGDWDGVVREMYFYPKQDLIILVTERTLLYFPIDDLQKVKEIEQNLAVLNVEAMELHKSHTIPKKGSIGLFGKNGQFDPETGVLTLSSGNGLFQIDFELQNIVKHYDKRVYANCTTDSSIWFGRTTGIGKLDLFGRISFPYNAHELMNISVLDIKEDRSGVLWIASDGYGVFGYSPQQNIFYGIKELESALVKRLYVQEKGKLWIATSEGIYQLNISSYQPFVYELKGLNRSDGLVSNEVNLVTTWKNQLVAGTNRGLSILKPDSWLQKNLKPEVVLEEIRVDGTTSIPSEGKSFDHNQNDLVFNFSMLQFQNHNKAVYHYRLLGLSDKWNTTSQHSVSFHNLKPNNYTFQIWVKSPSHLQSDTKSWDFTIVPHWTQKVWVKGLVIGFVLLGFIVGLWWWSRINRDKLRFQKEISSLQVQALQAQMNPHFIFNVLNSIQYLIGANRSEDANEYLALFARLIRHNIEVAENEMIPFQKELDGLRLYLELEEIRFGGNLLISIEVEKDIHLYKTMTPGSILQPLIEIILANRPEERKDWGITRVYVVKMSNHIHIEVINPVFKPISAFQKSDKVKSIQKRLKLLFGKSLEFESIQIQPFLKGAGVKISIQIPETIHPEASFQAV